MTHSFPLFLELEERCVPWSPLLGLPLPQQASPVPGWFCLASPTQFCSQSPASPGVLHSRHPEARVFKPPFPGFHIRILQLMQNILCWFLEKGCYQSRFSTWWPVGKCLYSTLTLADRLCSQIPGSSFGLFIPRWKRHPIVRPRPQPPPQHSH